MIKAMAARTPTSNHNVFVNDGMTTPYPFVTKSQHEVLAVTVSQEA
jgi:hypothetical protein